MVYGIFTAGQRTWGGPRADAAQADAQTSPQAAIEHAIAGGDELNIVPETFRPVVEAKTRSRAATIPHVTLQPSDVFEGRFRSSVRDYSVWYPPPDTQLALNRSATIPRHIPLHPRASCDSMMSASSAGRSVYLPRRVESFIETEGRRPPQRTRSHPSHPPFSQSAYFENRREHARLSSQSFQAPQHWRRSELAASMSEDSIDLGVLRNKSPTSREAGASIPLMG